MLKKLIWNPQDVIPPSAWEIKGTVKIVGGGVEGTIHSSNIPHHRVKSLFQVLTAALHIEFSVSIVRSGEIMRISAQNSCKTRRQITQEQIRIKSASVSPKEVVEVQ